MGRLLRTGASGLGVHTPASTHDVIQSSRPDFAVLAQNWALPPCDPCPDPSGGLATSDGVG